MSEVFPLPTNMLFIPTYTVHFYKIMRILINIGRYLYEYVKILWEIKSYYNLIQVKNICLH